MSTSPGQPAPSTSQIHDIRLDVIPVKGSGAKLYECGFGDPDNGVGFVSWPGVGSPYPRAGWAERFAACVNLLVGIPTETLRALANNEALPPSGVSNDLVSLVPKYKPEPPELPPLLDTLKHAGTYAFTSPAVADPRPSHIIRSYGTEWFWYSGPPPHIGWWNASNSQAEDAWRWWNGEHWSWPSYPDFGLTDIAYGATQREPSHIEWTYGWPEGARVPRINPDNGEVTGAGGVQ